VSSEIPSIAEQVDSLLARLTGRFGAKILVATAARNDTPDLLWALYKIAYHNPLHMVEIGTCHGVMATVLGLVAQHVTTVDVATYVPAHAGSPGGPTAFARVADVFEVAGLDNVWAVLAENEAEKQRFLRASPFDAAFIDGLHETDAVLADFEAVRKCGFVLFHNVSSHAKVKTAIEQIGDVTCFGNFGLWRE